MPRASRYLRQGYTYHLTQRCHDWRFLLRFARDRDVYREWLRVATARYKIPVYGYCLTSNHIHVIVHADNVESVGRMMHLVSGAFAQQLNRRKGHEGSVWEHPYHCTIIQDGRHLLNCLWYVHLNMVRAGQVQHPSEWRWCGHDELDGTRSRYRILDVDRLLENLEICHFDDLRVVYNEGISKLLEKQQLSRDPHWTESLAVGDRAFVERMASKFPNRRLLSYTETADTHTWSVHETTINYS